MKTVRIYFTFFNFGQAEDRINSIWFLKKVTGMLKIILKKIFQEYHLAINSLEPDQTQHFVGPDLGQNCFSNDGSR